MKEWTPPSHFEKFLYLVGTVILPAFLFFLAGDDALMPDPWQSGQPGVWLGLFLGHPVSRYFAPWLLYSIVCMLLLLIKPKQMSAYDGVRLGIYTGFILAFQYALAVLIYLIPFRSFHILAENLLILGVIIVGGTAVLLLPKLWNAIGNRWGRKGLVGATILAIGFAGFGGGIFILLVAPIACLALAGKLSWQLWRNFDQPLYLSKKGVFAGLGWLTGYIVSWQLAIYKTVDLYNQLPTEPPPDCYVVTAATHGHEQFVGRVDGVTPQLQRLKCGELAFMTVAPRWHKGIRRVYDLVGPRLARHVRRSAYLADLAYLLIKPLEWVVLLLLRVVLPNSNQLIQKMYRS